MRLNTLHKATIMLSTLIYTTSAFAGLIDNSVTGCDFSGGEINAACIPTFLIHVIAFIFGITGAYFVIMVVVAGYQIALAKALGKDRSEGFGRLRTAIIGFILCASSWFIIDFIISALART